MLTIISPAQFKQIPWKNGQGITTELALNKGGTLTDFNWRLSIASVVEDSEFSDFSGYWRNLVLISGDDIALQHTLNNETRTDNLTELLQRSSFAGESKTYGKLLGANRNKAGINDFNVMTKIGEYKTEVSTYTDQNSVMIKPCDLCFVYSLTDELTLTTTPETTRLPAEHLLKISSPKLNAITISGAMMIVIYLIRYSHW